MLQFLALSLLTFTARFIKRVIINCLFLNHSVIRGYKFSDDCIHDSLGAIKIELEVSLVESNEASALANFVQLMYSNLEYSM